MTKINGIDRYEGIMPYPNLDTVCKGDCDGMGLVPIKKDKAYGEYKQRWVTAHNHNHKLVPRLQAVWAVLKVKCYRGAWDALIETKSQCDGWHFVPCLACNGTGRRNDDTIRQEPDMDRT